jgi:hypothetical protein
MFKKAEETSDLSDSENEVDVVEECGLRAALISEKSRER